MQEDGKSFAPGTYRRRRRSTPIDQKGYEAYRRTVEEESLTIIKSREMGVWGKSIAMLVDKHATKIADSGNYAHLGDSSTVHSRIMNEYASLQAAVKGFAPHLGDLPIALYQEDTMRSVLDYPGTSREKCTLLRCLQQVGVDRQLRLPPAKQRIQRIVGEYRNLTLGPLEHLVALGFRIELCNDLFEGNILDAMAKQRQQLVTRRNADGSPLSLPELVHREYGGIIEADVCLTALTRSLSREAVLSLGWYNGGIATSMIHVLYDALANTEVKDGRRETIVADVQDLVNHLEAEDYAGALVIANKLGYFKD